MYRCKEHHKEACAYIYKHPLCGVLNTGMQLIPSQWIFNVYFQCGVHITFREFHLPCTRRCDQVAVLVGPSMDTVWNKLWKSKFCGKRAPWSMSQSQPYVIITVTSQSGKISYGIHFMLLYEAIDIKSPLIEKEHANFMFYVQLSTLIKFGKKYRAPRHIIHTYHFTACDALEVVCIRFSHDMDIKLFDGPGPLSRAVKSTHKNLNELCFSRFLGYAEISHHNMSSNITYWVKEAKSYSLGLCQRSIGYLDNESLHFTAHDTGAGVHCLWTTDHILDEMQVHHMLYQGYDMHFVNLSSLCQYGGLRVFLQIRSFNGYVVPFTSLCTSIYSKPTIPFHIVSVPMARIYVLFTSFHKYSTGYMEVTLRRSDCVVYDVYFYTTKPDDSIFPGQFF